MKLTGMKPHIDADFYSNIAMKLAKSLKQDPGNIAKDITEAIVDLMVFPYQLQNQVI